MIYDSQSIPEIFPQTNIVWKTVSDSQKIDQEVTHRKSQQEPTQTSNQLLMVQRFLHSISVIQISVPQYEPGAVMRSSGASWSLLSTHSQRYQVRTKLVLLVTEHLDHVCFCNGVFSPDISHFVAGIESPGTLRPFAQGVSAQRLQGGMQGTNLVASVLFRLGLHVISQSNCSDFFFNSKMHEVILENTRKKKFCTFSLTKALFIA